ncbi:MAG TPA: phage GP46 family protein [Ktedonobacterales bacterium]|nr:phage GP46 family protein [Ktedonobacterales bacterium]
MSGSNTSDIRTTFYPDLLYGDWNVAPPALESGFALETAVLISLFSDRLADVDEVLPGYSGDRRGWWADTDSQHGPIGSRLWLLHREKQTNEVRLRAEEYARESLQWLLDDDVADTVDIDAQWLRLGWLQLAIDIRRQQRRLFHGRYEWSWEQLV